MNDFSKLIITGDILRPTNDSLASSQNINIEWLYHLLSHQLTQATNLPVYPLTWSKEKFNTPLFYKLQGLQPTLNDWAILENSRILSDAALEYIYDNFSDSCVIGFELPGIFIHAFNKLNITYIDLIIHPIRFMPDIFFGASSNSNILWERLNGWSVSDESYYQKAGLHKAMISRQRDFSMHPNSSLIIGQTEVDRSKIFNGKIISFSDYEDQLKDHLDSADHIYYKPHPYALDTDHELKILRRLGKIEPISNNIYQVLAQPNLCGVVSLSSSVIFEAKYWGISSAYLYKNPFKLCEEYPNMSDALNQHAFNPIMSCILDSDFWYFLFTGESKVVNNKAARLYQPRNLLRNSLGNFWGYDFLDL